MKNPFIPVDVDNPTCYQHVQKKLVGEGANERRELSENSDNSENCLRALCDDVKKQRKRIGGDWAVCEVSLSSKKMRDLAKYTLFDCWKV